MTLIEIMVVIAIIGILSTAIGFGVVNWLKGSKESVVQMTLSKVSQALDAHYTMESDYPNSLDDLTSGKNPLSEREGLEGPMEVRIGLPIPGK